MPTQFSWIPFYREVAMQVLKREQQQDELLNVLKQALAQGLKVVSVNDKDEQGQIIPLTEIDPFTFFAAFNRQTNDRAAICAFFKKEWNLSAPVPQDFEGIPTIHNQASWFFAYLHKRQQDDVPTLWQMARMVFDSTPATLDSTLFQRCLAINKVGLAKLTMGMFWISPKGFFALDSLMRAYFAARGVDADWKAIESGDANAYRALANDVHEKLGYDHPQISLDAFKYWEQGHFDKPIKPGTDPEILLPDFPLNQILYGPPGTGKTYSTIARAVEIIDGETPDNRAECVARFQELRTAGQIAFITFHQSFAYEEFIEGLRPVVDEGSQSGARYAVRAGVFKEMALRALGAALERKVPVSQVAAGMSYQATFNELWDELLRRVQSEDKRITGRDSARYQLTLDGNGNLIIQKTTDDNRFEVHVSRSDVGNTWQRLEKESLFATSHIVAKPGDFTFLIVEELKRIESELQASPSISLTSANEAAETEFSVEEARDFLNDLSGYRLNAASKKRYVLIVDEINRGNISKIFGELITLLEEDKRLGAANPLRVLLPYSGDTFALPSNLYLLGTMNTADKSLALLDVALRRRFSFQELNPNFSICKLPDPAMLQVLEALNRRIMLVLDREHRIGHAFFMGVKTADEFNAVFADKIVPLLQEYFYNDWNGLRAVLGEKDAGKIIGTMASIEGVRGRNHYAWWHDLDQPTPDFFAVLRKNYGISGGATSLPGAANAVTSKEALVPDASLAAE